MFSTAVMTAQKEKIEKRIYDLEKEIKKIEKQVADKKTTTKKKK